MNRIPELLERVTIDASQSLLPLSLATPSVVYSRPITFCGQSTRTQSSFARVLRAAPQTAYVLMMPLMALPGRSLCTFERGGPTNEWVLVDRVSEEGADAALEPYDSLELERAALDVRLERHRPTSLTFQDALARLTLLVRSLVPATGAPRGERQTHPVGWAYLELGLGAAANGNAPLATEMLAHALEEGCAEAPTALAVLARLALERDELEAATVFIARLRESSDAGRNEDGSLFPRRWVDVHAAYLTGLVGARRGAGDDDGALRALEDTASDAEACAKDTAPYRTVGADGAITSMDIGTTVFLESTLDPALTRMERSSGARRALASILARRADHEGALTWLEGLDAPRDNLVRARLFLALEREGDATRALGAARDLPEAAALLQDIQRRAALSQKPKPAASSADFEVDDQVRHEKLGLGTVVDVEIVNGRASRVSVELEDGSTRMLPARSLTRVKPDS